MPCIKHSSCRHGRVKCDCTKCWKYETQCEYIYDDSTTIDNTNNRTVGTSGESRRVADNQKRTGYIDLYCTEKIYDTVGTTTAKGSYFKIANRRSEEFSQEGTQLSIRTGTSSPIGFSFPTPGSRKWEKYIRILTNISSQKIRKDLLSGLLGILENNFKPLKTWIEIGTENDRGTSLATTTTEDVIRGITQAKANIQDLIADFAPTWKTRRKYVITHHKAEGRDERAQPPMKNAKPSSSTAKKSEDLKKKTIIHKILGAKRKKQTTAEEKRLLDEEDEILATAAAQISDEAESLSK